MPDENQMTKEEQANQELIRLAELRIKELYATYTNLGHKSILLTSISFACAVFFFTLPLTDEEFSIKINYLIEYGQMACALAFFIAGVNAAGSINLGDMHQRGWGKLLNRLKDYPLPIIVVQRAVLHAYIDIIVLKEEFYKKVQKDLMKSIYFFIFCIMGAVFFLIFIKVHKIIGFDLEDMGSAAP